MGAAAGRRADIKTRQAEDTSSKAGGYSHDYLRSEGVPRNRGRVGEYRKARIHKRTAVTHRVTSVPPGPPRARTRLSLSSLAAVLR